MNYNLNPYDHCKVEADPKPELSTSTLLINLEALHRRVMASQQAYSMAYFEWLHLGEQIKERLADEQRKEMQNFNKELKP